MAGQQQQQNTDNSLAILWGIALVFSSGWLIWYFFHDVIAQFIISLRVYEARFIGLIIPKINVRIASWLLLNPHEVTMRELMAISHVVGYYLRFPLSLMLLMFAALIYINRAPLRFKKDYNMRLLAQAERQNWVQITPVVNLDLVKTDIDSGPWAMALTPIQFAKKNDLLQLERIIPSVSTAVTVIGDHYVQAKLRHEAARQTFAIQLGAPWQGVENLPLLIKALFSIFAARAARDRASADYLMAQIARSAIGISTESGEHLIRRLNFAGVETLLEKYMNHPSVTKVIHKHAYVLTVMASMLNLARQDGVLASSEFLWVKPCDRTLWFMLNCVGRQTAYVEAAGPFSHWIAERAVGRKLHVPMIDMAVNALETALNEVRLSAEEAT